MRETTQEENGMAGGMGHPPSPGRALPPPPLAETNVLVTMDPGQDLDDEMLIVLMNSLRRRGLVNCLGVVATLAPAEMRAQLARGTLDELGMRGVPVAAGSDGGDRGSTDNMEGLSYVKSTWCALSGDDLMRDALASSDDGSVTVLVVASLKDVAGLLRREEDLFRRKVKRAVIMGGVQCSDDGSLRPDADTGLLVPDTAHNNKFDSEASAYFYRRCQELGVPLVVVSRFCAYACQMPRQIYDDLAGTGSRIGVHLKATQASSIERLWRRANAPEGTGDREGLPARCNREWFCDTFCGGKGKDRDGSRPIWDLVQGFNMYDPMALVATVPSLADGFFEFEELQANGVTHRVAGTSKSRCGVKPGAPLQKFMLDSFLEGIQPTDGETEVQRMRNEIARQRAEIAQLREEIAMLCGT